MNIKLFSRKKKSKVHVDNFIFHIQPNDPDICAICLCDFEDNRAIYITKCNHVYHVECIETWFKKKYTCPLCKTPI